MYKFVLGENSDGNTIYVNTISSPAGTYISRRPYIFALLKEILLSQTLRGQRIVIEQDMGRNIGTTDIVTTSDSDNVYYARPLKSEVYYRFAKNRYPQLCSTLTIVVDKDADGNYEVSDTWIGNNRPPFPGDVAATKSSLQYWATHALVPDSQPVQTKSLTKTCPY
jgi:hypothetical protein